MMSDPSEKTPLPRPPPPPESSEKPSVPAERTEEHHPDLKSQDTILMWRRRGGWGVGFAGVATVLAMGWLALQNGRAVWTRPPRTREELWFAALVLLAESVVSVAMMYFGYQLLRVAERMVLPAWWVRRENIDAVRLMLGIDTPADGAAKALKSATDLVEAVQKIKADPPRS